MHAVRWTYTKDGKKFTDERKIREYGEHKSGVFLGRVGNGEAKMFRRVESIEDAMDACKLITPYPVDDVKIVDVGEGHEVKRDV
jgi:hypothetical protein